MRQRRTATPLHWSSTLQASAGMSAMSHDRHMENAAYDLLDAWEAYYVILGSSAAALTGLQFVVIALVADMPGFRSEESVGAFATPTIVHFCQCLFMAAVLSSPWTSLTPVTWLFVAAGSAGVFYTLIALRRARRQTAYHPVAEDWLWHT